MLPKCFGEAASEPAKHSVRHTATLAINQVLKSTTIPISNDVPI